MYRHQMCELGQVHQMSELGQVQHYSAPPLPEVWELILNSSMETMFEDWYGTTVSYFNYSVMLRHIKLNQPDVRNQYEWSNILPEIQPMTVISTVPLICSV